MGKSSTLKRAMNFKILILLVAICAVTMTDAWGRRLFSRRNLRFAGKVGLAALSHYGDNKEDEVTYKKLLHSMVNQLNEDMGEEKARIFLTDLADMSEMFQAQNDSQLNEAASSKAVKEDSDLDEKTLELLADF